MPEADRRLPDKLSSSSARESSHGNTSSKKRAKLSDVYGELSADLTSDLLKGIVSKIKNKGKTPLASATKNLDFCAEYGVGLTLAWRVR